MSLTTIGSKQPSHFFWIIIISCTITVLWLISGLVILVQGGGSGSGAWGIFTFVALPATVIAPLAYGWHTKDTPGAVIIGLFPFLLAMGVAGIVSGNTGFGYNYRVYSVLFIVALSVIGGMEGFLAAKKNLASLIIGIVLAGIWIGVFLSGVN